METGLNVGAVPTYFGAGLYQTLDEFGGDR